jgi:uncharacterized Tic20 family protein
LAVGRARFFQFGAHTAQIYNLKVWNAAPSESMATESKQGKRRSEISLAAYILVVVVVVAVLVVVVVVGVVVVVVVIVGVVVGSMTWLGRI